MRPAGLRRGDISVIAEISKARGLNRGKGYAVRTVKAVVVSATRRNTQILNIANELIASRKQLMRKPRRNAA